MSAQNNGTIWVRCDTLYTPFERHRDVVLKIRHGRVQEILSVDAPQALSADPMIYEPGTSVAPGLIDLHVHGARGRDLMDGTLESLQTVSETLARHGTTSFLATTLSASESDTEIAVRGMAAQTGTVLDGACLIGIHLEGPYLNPLRRGTHNTDHLKLPSVPAFRRLVELSGNIIRKVTVAPEIDGALRLIREAVGLGIPVSLGHSNATWEQAKAAVDAGASHATHTFNAMRPLHHREPGILGLVLTDDRVFAEIIADGIHVHPAMVKLLVRTKKVEKVLLVTDGISAVDMPDGDYPLGDKTVVVRQGECRDHEGVLAGSTLTLDRAVVNVIRWLECPLAQVLATASAYPARSLGMETHKGRIAPGADADLIFLDPSMTVVKTMVGGKIVFSRD